MEMSADDDKGGSNYTIPQYLSRDVPQPCHSLRLIGFRDSSTKAYTAVVYLRLETQENVDVKFVMAKT